MTRDQAVEKYLYDPEFNFIVNALTASFMRANIKLDDIPPAVELAIDKYKRYANKKT